MVQQSLDAILYVIITPKRRRNVVLTYWWRYHCVVWTLGTYFSRGSWSPWIKTGFKYCLKRHQASSCINKHCHHQSVHWNCICIDIVYTMCWSMTSLTSRVIICENSVIVPGHLIKRCLVYKMLFEILESAFRKSGLWSAPIVTACGQAPLNPTTEGGHSVRFHTGVCSSGVRTLILF